MKSAALLVLAVALSTHSARSVGAESTPKPIGISIEVDTDSLFGGKVNRIVVTKVAPESQAKAAGVTAGDEIVQLEGKVVQGVEAKALKPHMEFVPGKSKRIGLKRTDGSLYEVTLTKHPVQAP